jgi:hypothetical protein
VKERKRIQPHLRADSKIYTKSITFWYRFSCSEFSPFHSASGNIIATSLNVTSIKNKQKINVTKFPRARSTTVSWHGNVWIHEKLIHFISEYSILHVSSSGPCYISGFVLKSVRYVIDTKQIPGSQNLKISKFWRNNLYIDLKTISSVQDSDLKD